jgi:hypothetical protein
MEGLLKSIGLVKNFAPIVYVNWHMVLRAQITLIFLVMIAVHVVVRPGSVNARVAAGMLNNQKCESNT